VIGTKLEEMMIRLNNNDASIVSCVAQYGKIAGDYLKQDIKKCSRDARLISRIMLTGKAKGARMEHIQAAQDLLTWHDMCCGR